MQFDQYYSQRTNVKGKNMDADTYDEVQKGTMCNYPCNLIKKNILNNIHIMIKFKKEFHIQSSDELLNDFSYLFLFFVCLFVFVTLCVYQ